MRAVVWHADPVTGQCWASLPTLAKRAQMDLRTARAVLTTLARERRFLRAEPMTWQRLTEICRAQGRYLPNRADLGTAPYLITLLDGEGNPAIGMGGPPPTKKDREEQGHRERRAHEHHLERRANAEPAQDKRSHHEPEKDTPTPRALDGWGALYEAHAAKSRDLFQQTPPKPERTGLTEAQRMDMGEAMSEGAELFAAHVNEHTGTTLERGEALQMLAARVIDHYFAREGDGGYLVARKHRIKDLDRELYDRLIDARMELQRELVHAHMDATSSRKRPPVEPEPAAPEAHNEHVKPADAERERAEIAAAVQAFRAKLNLKPLDQKQDADERQAQAEREREEREREQRERAERRAEQLLEVDVEPAAPWEPERPWHPIGTARWGCTKLRRVRVRHVEPVAAREAGEGETDVESEPRPPPGPVQRHRRRRRRAASDSEPDGEDPPPS